MTYIFKKLESASSIYDVITILFQAITLKNELKNLSLHRKWINQPEKSSSLVHLIQIVQIMCGHPIDDFKSGLHMLIQLYKTNPSNVISLMVETLFCFDNELSAFSGDRQRKQVNHGPMNSTQSQQQENAYLYIAAHNMLQNDFLSTHKLRRGGKRVTPHPSGLQNKLKNYTVIPKNKLGGLIPQISAYYLSEKAQKHFREDPLRIAVFPFTNRMWFDWPHTESNLGFDIVFSEEQDQETASAYIRALDIAEEQKADLVIFPEMVYSSRVKERIQDYLHQTSLSRKYVKLIFSGTEWVNGINTAYILNASGRSLLSQKKREPVDFFDKKANQAYRENLRDHSGQFSFLDVVGLGRIAYSVCRDFIDPAAQLIIGGFLESGFIAASCYTPELGPFQTEAESLVKQYGAISLVCNACASLHDRGRFSQEAVVGFLSVPTYSEKKELLCDTIAYQPLDSNCTENKCGLCNCVYVYTLTHSSDGSGQFYVALESAKS